MSSRRRASYASRRPAICLSTGRRQVAPFGDEHAGSLRVVRHDLDVRLDECREAVHRVAGSRSRPAPLPRRPRTPMPPGRRSTRGGPPWTSRGRTGWRPACRAPGRCRGRWWRRSPLAWNSSPATASISRRRPPVSIASLASYLTFVRETIASRGRRCQPLVRSVGAVGLSPVPSASLVERASPPGGERPGGGRGHRAVPRRDPAIAFVEAPPLAVPDASPIYLVAVVGVAVVLGTGAAVVAAFVSFLLYDWLFVEPRFTLAVEDPDGVAQPAPVPVRGDRDRQARGAPIGPGRGCGPASPRVAGAVPDQPDAGDGPERRRRTAGDPGGTGRRDAAEPDLVRPPGRGTRGNRRRYRGGSSAVAEGPRPAHADAGRPPAPLGPGASAPGPPRRSNRKSGDGAVPREDRRRRGDAGLHLGDAVAPRRTAGSGRDAAAQPCRRPDRACLQAREAGRDRECSRDRAAERGAQGRPPRLRVARPPHAVGRDPCRRRQPDGSRGRLDGRAAPGGGPDDRSRGRSAQRRSSATCST